MATLNLTPIKTFISGETVTPAKLNELSQSTVALTAGSIVAADIAADAVTAAKLADSAVTNAKIASGVDASKLTTGTLPADRIGSSAITTARINDAAVTAAKLDGAQTGAAPIYGCRAWVNFDGTSVTNVDGEDRCTIRASGNVTKAVRNGTGDYTVHFTAAMPDANYSALVTNQSTFFSGQAFSTASAISEAAGAVSASSVRVIHIPAGDVSGYNGAVNNSAVMCVSIFR